ncbi:MAG: GNAT family N-acetyltransferase [Clostridiales Family XIII bacterium]|jgi:ribosomal protein S18 acetylase RimI-like enzyme|nr:GNAT family N-acetyltransferase [Clostridiales Family XIII bacterium]
MLLKIQPAYDELDKVRELFVEYQTTMGLDLCFQNFEDELAFLPGKYAEPQGRLYIATFDGSLAGCIAVRPFGGGACEMKRLYVRPQFRALGVGRALAEQAINDARHIGYARMLLDTLSSMKGAIALYRKLGFTDIEPYYYNPGDNVVYLGLALGRD